MANPGIHKTYKVVGELASYRIVALAGTGGNMTVSQAASASAALIGPTDELGKQSNGTADIAMSGMPEVECGGAVAVGAPLTADADGKAVTATAAGARIIGFALEDGAASVIITYQHTLGFKA